MAVSGASVTPARQARAFATLLWRLGALQRRNVHTRFCENQSNGSKLQWCQTQADIDSMVIQWKESNLKITFHPFEHQNANITFAYTSLSSQTFNELLQLRLVIHKQDGTTSRKKADLHYKKQPVLCFDNHMCVGTTHNFCNVIRIQSYICIRLPLLFIVLTSYAANQRREGVLIADSPISLLHSRRRPRVLQLFEDTNLYDVQMKFLPQQEYTKGS